DIPIRRRVFPLNLAMRIVLTPRVKHIKKCMAFPQQIHHLVHWHQIIVLEKLPRVMRDTFASSDLPDLDPFSHFCLGHLHYSMKVVLLKKPSSVVARHLALVSNCYGTASLDGFRNPTKIPKKTGSQDFNVPREQLPNHDVVDKLLQQFIVG
ncbi:MAG TPA: hypothetical protein VGO21_04170, partial [Candidatus Paceibacterota bacterium]|nr:hypothetical protein [Candidatus Paceibacterota bacterium]